MTNADLDKICFSLKGTTQDVKWESNLCYLVGNKMYCIALLDLPFGVGFKVQPEEFSVLTERDGIVPAPYLARNSWVKVESPQALSPREWKHYIVQSYELVFASLTKKMQAAIKNN